MKKKMGKRTRFLAAALISAITLAALVGLPALVTSADRLTPIVVSAGK